LKISAIVMAVCAVGLLCGSGGCDSDGSLTCPAGAVLCGTQCSNVQGDPDNCGACGTVCAHGSICDLGVCTSAGFDAGRAVEAAAPAPQDASSDSAKDAVADTATDTGTATDAGVGGQ
jgi:hypothetical protein